MDLEKARRLYRFIYKLNEYNIYTKNRDKKHITLKIIQETETSLSYPFLNNKSSLYIPFIFKGYLVNWYKYDN